MKEKRLYEGTAGDSIDDALPIVIAKAKELGEDVFLRWNGATLRVAPLDTVKGLLQEYQEQLHGFSLIQLEKQGDLYTKQQLKERVFYWVENFMKSCQKR